MSLKSQSVPRSHQGHHRSSSTSLSGDALTPAADDQKCDDDFTGSEMNLELDSPKGSVGQRPTEFAPCDESVNTAGQRQLQSAEEENHTEAHGGGILGLSTSMFLPESFPPKASTKTRIDVPAIQGEEEVQISRRILEDVSSSIPIQTSLQREREDLQWNIIGPLRANTLLQSMTPQTRKVAVAMKSGVDEKGSLSTSPRQFGKRAKAMELLHFELDHEQIQKGILSPAGSRVITYPHTNLITYVYISCALLMNRYCVKPGSVIADVRRKEWKAARACG